MKNKKESLKEEIKNLEEQLNSYITKDSINKVKTSRNARLKEFKKIERDKMHAVKSSCYGNSNYYLTAAFVICGAVFMSFIPGAAIDAYIYDKRQEQEIHKYKITYINESTARDIIEDEYILDKPSADYLRIIAKSNYEEENDYYKQKVSIYNLNITEDNLNKAKDCIENGYYYTIANNISTQDYYEISPTPIEEEASVSYEYSKKEVITENKAKSSIIFTTASMTIGAISGLTIMYKSKWKKYEREFGETRKDLKKKKKLIKKYK